MMARATRALNRVRLRAASCPDTEYEQAAIRLVIGAMLFAYFGHIGVLAETGPFVAMMAGLRNTCWPTTNPSVGARWGIQ